MKSSVVATLMAGEARVDLALVPDPERRARAMAHALGYAISHLATEPPEPIRGRLGALRNALDALGDTETDEGAALPQIARACRAAIPGARMVIRRRFPADQRAPLWPASMRSGAPSEAGHGVWPYDAELAGLLLGRRRLLLREALAEARADADVTWLASHGVATLVVDAPDPGGSMRIYGSLDASMLEEAAAMHAAACREHDGWAQAALWMGDALGYPKCCAEVFARARKRDDVTMFLELLPPLPHAPASPLTVWLDGALALVSHAPCSLACVASVDLARAVLGELERKTVGFAAKWRALAERIHAVTADGRVFAIAAEGDLVTEGAVRVIDAIELVPLVKGSGAVVKGAEAIRPGDELRVERGWLVGPANSGWTGTFVADHRGGDA